MNERLTPSVARRRVGVTSLPSSPRPEATRIAAHRFHHRARPGLVMACLRPRYHRTRAPSDGSTSNLAAGAGSRVIPSTFTRAHPAPFHLPRIRPVLGRAAVSELPCAPRPFSLRHGEDAFHRRLQPTSRHEHPSNRPSPESPASTSQNLPVSFGDRARAFAQRPRLPRSTASIEISAEDMNRVEPRLTTRVQLRRG